MKAVNAYWGSLVVPLLGFFLGFAFGLGCALAVMYSIYMGGYRAAARDAAQPEPPPRWLAARDRAHTEQPAPPAGDGPST